MRSQRVVLRPAARALCLDSTRCSFVNVAPWGCDLPTRRQPKHRVQIICTPDQWSAREDVQGRAMSPVKSISDENRARPIATLNWRWPRPSPLPASAEREQRRRLPLPHAGTRRGGRSYFTQDQRDIRQCPVSDINRFKSEVKQPGQRAHPRRTVMIAMFRTLAACGAVLSTVAAADAKSIDWAKVDGIFGRTGAVGGAVHRYGFPRTDLTVTLDGVTIRPTLSLGGWIAFQPIANTALGIGR